MYTGIALMQIDFDPIPIYFALIPIDIMPFSIGIALIQVDFALIPIDFGVIQVCIASIETAKRPLSVASGDFASAKGVMDAVP